MDSTSVFSFLDIIVVLAGAYVLYAWYLLAFQKEIRQGVLVPKDVDPKKCKNLDGYAAYMSPRVLALGILALVSGGIGVYQDTIQPVNAILYWVVFALFLGVLIWFGYCSRKAIREFF